MRRNTDNCFPMWLFCLAMFAISQAVIEWVPAQDTSQWNAFASQIDAQPVEGKHRDKKHRDTDDDVEPVPPTPAPDPVEPVPPHGPRPDEHFDKVQPEQRPRPQPRPAKPDRHDEKHPSPSPPPQPDLVRTGPNRYEWVLALWCLGLTISVIRIARRR